MSSPSAQSTMPSNCLDFEQYLLHSPYHILFQIHLVIMAINLGAIVVLIRQHCKHRIAVHGNLLFLFTNIVLLNFFHALAWFAFLLRYRVLLFVYKQPCELLTPVWMVPLFHGPYFANSVAFPAFHLLVMLERLRATLYAEKYEREGGRLCFLLVFVIWLLSFGYMGYVICAGLADTESLGHDQGLVQLTSNLSAQPILYTMLAALVLVILTALCDWRIFLMNRRIRAVRNYALNYSLSRRYQLNENALVMRLILPLDISYALLYPVYIGLVILIRAHRNSLPATDYNMFYHLANTLLFLHSAVTIVVYIQFVKFLRRSQKRNVTVARAAYEHGKLHFKQLQAQWDK